MIALRFSGVGPVASDSATQRYVRCWSTKPTLRARREGDEFDPKRRPSVTGRPLLHHLRLTSDGRTPNFRRNVVLKCDELLNPSRYATSVTDRLLSSGRVSTS